MSLRRQLLNRNVSRDFLLQGTTLQTLPEEGEEPGVRKNVPITDLDATYDSIIEEPSDKPAIVEVSKEFPQNSGQMASRDYMSNAESRSPIYRPPQSGPPGTPYTEIEEPKKQKPKLTPLKFNFPTTSSGSRESLPFSPIVAGSRHSIQSVGRCDDLIPALPMSPAAFLSTSTPAPNTKDITMDCSPLCHSLMDSSIFTNNPECNMCRICHEDGSKEALISPCHCAGTMGMLHMSCLEKWLGSSNTTKCEICQFKFVVHKKPHSFKWYMTEPTLRKDRWILIKDFLITLTLTLLVLLVNSMCLVFTHRLIVEKQHGPAAVLIIIVVGGTFFFCMWIWFVGRRFHQQLISWHKTYHVLQIKQTTTEKQQSPNNHLFSRPTIRLPKSLQRKKPEPTEIPTQTLLASTYFNFSMESYQSYKEAMCNPVCPIEEPLLQEDNNNEITSLDHNSSSVVSLYYEEEQSSVTYYQPTGFGSTVTYCGETGRSFSETGV